MTDEKLYNLLRRQVEAAAGRESELKVLIFGHRQGDPDALCSAGALKSLLENLFQVPKLSIRVIIPQGASLLGRHVSNTLGIDFEEEVDGKSILESDFVIVVDTGDPKLLEPFADVIGETRARKTLVDHHGSSLATGTWESFDDCVVVPVSTSTCEIISLGFPKEMLTKKISDMLLVGLLFDSQHLGIATKNTLRAALVLAEAGSDIATCKRILRHEPDRSEVIGRLKAAQRLRYDEANGQIIAVSEISSYHAAVARMLVDIGSDVGIAYGETGGESRLSARSSPTFFKRTGIDLSVEVKKAADHFNIIGGGHSTAASISGKIDAGVLADYMVQNLKSRLLQKR
jgi:nanoRNase/pAp phosphatase (c-di-AMP/oligoRNAs hydrolase)